jgi:hypothetical protein
MRSLKEEKFSTGMPSFPTNLQKTLERINWMHSHDLEFYMSSYLLDVVSNFNIFMGLCWSWSLERTPFHVYFKDL